MQQLKRGIVVQGFHETAIEIHLQLYPKHKHLVRKKEKHILLTY